MNDKGFSLSAIKARLVERRCVDGDTWTLVARVEALEAALRFELDACWCDDRDGNCNPPHNDECERCRRLSAALEGP